MTTTLLRPDTDGSPGRRVGAPRRRTLALIAAGVVVLALFAVWLVVFSTAFGVRTIEVHGVHSLSKAEIEGRARIADGTPLVRVNTAAITSRIETLPEVRSAEVSTSFPSTVVITVVERTPVGFVRTGSTYTLVDRTGEAFRAVGSRPADLPRLVVPVDSSARAVRRAAAGVAAVIDTLAPAARPHLKSIQALAPDAITLVLSHGRVVQWGSAARSADKARVLPILLRKKSHTVFDVSNPDQPFSN